jgi:hypothetical protein
LSRPGIVGLEIARVYAWKILRDEVGFNNPIMPQSVSPCYDPVVDPQRGFFLGGIGREFPSNPCIGIASDSIGAGIPG